MQISLQKHFGMFLVEKLSFVERLKYIADRVNTSLGLST